MKKKHIFAIATMVTVKELITLAVLCATFFVLLTLALLGKFVWGWFDPEEETSFIQPDLEAGESYFYFNGVEMKDVILMFPQIERADIFNIRVCNTKGENYFFYHQIDETKDYFLLGESDEFGNFENADIYMPPIVESFANFNYSTLYDDSTKIPTMLSAVGTPAVIERIFPDADKGEIINAELGIMSEAFLARYGLSKADDPAYYELIVYMRDPKYKDRYLYTVNGGNGDIIRLEDDKKYYFVNEDGTNGAQYTGSADSLVIVADVDATKRVYVGSPTIDDSGYYIYLEGRPTVYTTNSTYIADVVGRSLGYYIAPRLVSEAESEISVKLCPGFSIENGEFVDSRDAVITENATLGVNTGALRSYDSNGSKQTSSVQRDSFHMVNLADTEDELARAFREALLGKKIGSTVDVLVTAPALARRGEVVTYNIIEIRGIMKNATYVEPATEGVTGDVLAGDEKIVVAYRDGTVNPQSGEQYVFMGYVDLAKLDKTSELYLKLVGKRVGATCDERVTVTYDKSTDATYYFTYELDEIVAIKDANGESVDAVAYGTTVLFTYSLFEGEEKVAEGNLTVEVPDATRYNDDAYWRSLFGTDGQNADKLAYIRRTLVGELMGLKIGSYLNADGDSTKPIKIPFAIEGISDFSLYQDATASYAVTYRDNLAFGYENEVDPFYSSTSYKVKNDSEKQVYGIDHDTATKVVDLFNNLVGGETVAVGLDSETIDKYSLYDYRLSFTMPYECYTKEQPDGRYFFHYEQAVPFDLYLSRKMADGSRYIASVQYNIVVKYENGSDFDFVDWSFYAKWAQNALMLVSYENLRRMVFDLNFSAEDGKDYNHVWAFDITVDPAYKYTSSAGSEKPRLYAALVDGGDHTGIRSYRDLVDLLTYSKTFFDPSSMKESDRPTALAGVFVHTISEHSATVYKLTNPGWQDLDAVYGDQYTSNGVDKTGSENMRSLLQILNSMRYWGEAADDLTDAERAEILAGDYTMRFALTLWNKADGGENGYTFTFYNYSGHSLVSIRDEQPNEDGEYMEGALFYVQSREVNRLAEAVVELTRGETIDVNKY